MIHIEFIGVNGAGKSTLYHQSNAYLSERLGYKPGPDKLWLRMVDDEAMQPAAIRKSWGFRLLQALDPKKRLTHRLPASSENNFGFLARAAMHKGELIRKFMQLNASAHGAGPFPEPDAYRHWELQYFFSLLTFYQTCLENERDFILLDEGFVSVFTEHLIKANGVDEGLRNELLEANFDVAPLFHVTADPDVCLARLAARGVPAPYQHFSAWQLQAFLAGRDADIARVCDRLRETGTPVVAVSNNDTPRAAFEQLKPHLDAIIALSGPAESRPRQRV